MPRRPGMPKINGNDDWLSGGKDHYAKLEPALVATLDPTARGYIPNQWIIDRGVCPDCGWVHTRCRGHKQHTDHQQPCHKSAARDNALCTSHGGRTPVNRKAARMKQARRALESQFGDVLAECLAEVEGRTDTEAIVILREKADALVETYKRALAELPYQADADVETVYSRDDVPHVKVTVREQGVIGPNARGELTEHPLVRMLYNAITQAAQIHKISADLGIAERQQSLNEEQARIVVSVIRSVLTELGIGWDDARVPAIIGAQLRAHEAIEASATG